jgi:hypothetical protein
VHNKEYVNVVTTVAVVGAVGDSDRCRVSQLWQSWEFGCVTRVDKKEESDKEFGEERDNSLSHKMCERIEECLLECKIVSSSYWMIKDNIIVIKSPDLVKSIEGHYIK